MIGAPDMIITDSGNNILRKIEYDIQTDTKNGTQLIALNNMGKVAYSSNGIILPDNENNQLLYLQKDGSFIDQLSMSQSNTIAVSYEQDHQILYKPQNTPQLKHLYIPKTSLNATPTALSQQFIQAYLANDDKTMLEFSSMGLIDSLRVNAVDIKAREAFSNMISYQESIYFYGLKAVVAGKAQVVEGVATIKFYFVWKNGRWLLSGVI